MLTEPALPGPLGNYTAVVDPTAAADSSLGYMPGSVWINTAHDEAFVCVHAAVGAAIWVEVGGSGGGVHLDVRDPLATDDSASGYDDGSLWENTVDSRMFVSIDDTVGAAVWIPIAPLPTKEDLAKHPLATTGDGQYTGVTITRKPAGIGSGAAGNKVVLIDINGADAEVGDGVTTKDCYFSGSAAAPYAARNLADVQALDKLIWNESVAGYSLAPTDVIRLFYLSLWFVAAGAAIWGAFTWGAATWGV